MRIRTTLFAAIAVLLTVPALASANSCFSKQLQVIQGGVNNDGTSAFIAKFSSIQSAPRRGDSIHLSLQVQKWNGMQWRVFTTSLHRTSYTRKGRRPVLREWTLNEDNTPIMADSTEVPTRVIARITGACHGRAYRESVQQKLIPYPAIF